MAGLAAALGIVAGLIHAAIFVAESVRFRTPGVWKRFGVPDQAQADTLAQLMLNQGYYNLFLALGAITGAILVLTDVGGRTTLLGYVMLFMLGAAIVLVASDRRMVRAALIQGGIPALTLVALAFVS